MLAVRRPLDMPCRDIEKAQACLVLTCFQRLEQEPDALNVKQDFSLLYEKKPRKRGGTPYSAAFVFSRICPGHRASEVPVLIMRLASPVPNSTRLTPAPLSLEPKTESRAVSL